MCLCIYFFFSSVPRKTSFDCFFGAHTLLREQQTVALLQQYTMPESCQLFAAVILEPDSLPRVLVVRGKSGRMCAFGDSAIKDLAQSVDALASGWVFGVHQMHAGQLRYASKDCLNVGGMSLSSKAS
jgi:hypothetical protein